MKCNAFIKSLKVQNNNFRSEVIRTSNAYTYLEMRYKELQQNAVPIFLHQTEPDVQLSTRREEREKIRSRQDTARREKEKREGRRISRNNEQSFPQQKTRRVAAPCKVTPFITEKFTPFNAKEKNVKLSKSFPSHFKPKKKRPCSVVTAKLPRVAFLTTTTPI
ncbi:hypothetical protein TRFO_42265 [Tritrichomonas foetus]|uniref:Uncharacterized protein n=1 Tax=Tritrichomonas foetus TaxID=1144522 RepID=A0A1J4KX63_9EUKA|nr:hypothetical protein TRFO_42265 [Tritrichomonas foetus]|eukprot:OHT15823.1 hypothetical protein TRFO_42265 [Tritrichomonas foetus]